MSAGTTEVSDDTDTEGTVGFETAFETTFESGLDTTDDPTTGGPLPTGRPDLDGDGVIDYVFSARGHDGFAGAVWIDYDADAITDGPSGADVRLDGGTNLGLSLALCDLDGDGIDDLLAGSLAGIHVYWGGARLVDGAVEDLLITSVDQLSVVAGLGCTDVTGDGTPDVIGLGASFATWSLTMVMGGPDLRTMAVLDADADPTAVHIDSSDGSLLPALGLGDVDGDDVADIVVGASLGGNLGNGAAFVFRGGDTLTSGTSANATTMLVGDGPSSDFGSSVAVGDLDGDGIDDIAVADGGRVSIFRGGPGLSMIPEQTLQFPELVTPPAVTSTFRFGPADPSEALGIETTDEGMEVFLAVRRPFDDLIVVCSVALDGMEQTAPRPLEPAYAELLPAPARGSISVPVLRHGRTNEITFMPDGDGRMQSLDWLESDCEDMEGAGPSVEIMGVNRAGSTQLQWSDFEGWSALGPRLP